MLDDKEIKYVCGIDAHYIEDSACCSADIMERQSHRVIELENLSTRISKPYIPGLFMLREAKPLLATLKLLKKNYDLLLVDAHGVSHPRRFGLACYVGTVLKKPTIGVAKSLLCGHVRHDQYIEDRGQTIGFRVTGTGNFKKAIYVSVGHLVSLASSVRIVRELALEGRLMPEPLRIADINSKNKLNFQEKIQYQK